MGLFLFIVTFIACIFAYLWIPNSFGENYAPEKMARLELILKNENLDNKRKYYISAIIAEKKFMETGKLVEIFNHSGEKEIFKPNETTIEIYQLKQYALSLLPEIKNKVIILFLTLLLSVGSGLLLRKREREKQAGC